MDLLRIRRMGPEDISFGMQLKNQAGWNQLIKDWHNFLELAPAGCFLAEHGGERAGTVIALNYGYTLGWIGMLLVSPRKRRKGIGTALLCRAIEHLEDRGVETIGLDATPLGRKLYIKHGFRVAYRVDRYAGPIPEAEYLSEDRRVQFLQKGDLASVAAFDREIFGADRSHMLRILSKDHPAYSLLIREGKGLAGYIMARPGHNNLQVGPAAALTQEAAASLLGTLLGRIDEKKIYLDLPESNLKAAELVEGFSLVVQRRFWRMYRGPDHDQNPSCILATSGPAKG